MIKLLFVLERIMKDRFKLGTLVLLPKEFHVIVSLICLTSTQNTKLFHHLLDFNQKFTPSLR